MSKPSTPKKLTLSMKQKSKLFHQKELASSHYSNIKSLIGAPGATIGNTFSSSPT